MRGFIEALRTVEMQPAYLTVAVPTGPSVWSADGRKNSSLKEGASPWRDRIPAKRDTESNAVRVDSERGRIMNAARRIAAVTLQRRERLKRATRRQSATKSWLDGIHGTPVPGNIGKAE